jgi:hypothetical protein
MLFEIRHVPSTSRANKIDINKILSRRLGRDLSRRLFPRDLGEFRPRRLPDAPLQGLATRVEADCETPFSIFRLRFKPHYLLYGIVGEC